MRILFIFITALSLTVLSCSKQCGEVDCSNGNCRNGLCECDDGFFRSSDSCITDPCYQVECNNGQCIEGDCVCSQGYEGVDCQTRVNQKFLGSYTASQACSPGASMNGYQVTATDSSGINDVFSFNGLRNSPTAVVARVSHLSANTQFEIAKQSYGPNNMIEGSGFLETNGSISLVFKIYDVWGVTVIEDCTANLSP